MVLVENPISGIHSTPDVPIDPQSVIDKYLHQLEIVKCPDQGVLIAWTGIPSAGKTTLSEKISARYRLSIISPDKITDLIDPNLNLEKLERREIILGQVLPFIQNLPNRSSLIFDAGNDRDIDRYLRLVQSFTGLVFLVDLYLPQNTAYERIMARNGWKTNPYVTNLYQWIADYQRFVGEFGRDYSLRLDGRESIERNLQVLTEYLDPLLLGV